MTVVAECKCADCDRSVSPEDAEDLTGWYWGEEKIICEECDEYYKYCSVCDDRLYKDQPCRHLCWNSFTGDWDGCGSNYYEKQSKRGMHALLDFLGGVTARRMLYAIESHRYYHQLSGTIFGYNSMLVEWGTPDGRWDYCPQVMEPLFDLDDSDEHYHDISIGIGWLLSLWAGDYPKQDDCGLNKTLEADNLTAAWIREWLRIGEA